MSNINKKRITLIELSFISGKCNEPSVDNGRKQRNKKKNISKLQINHKMLYRGTPEHILEWGLRLLTNSYGTMGDGCIEESKKCFLQNNIKSTHYLGTYPEWELR